jgi:hypothetical protein
MSKSNKKKEEARLTKKGRAGSRQLLLQALYQYQLNGDGFDVLFSQLKQTKEFSQIDQTHFKYLLQEILKNLDKLDKISSKHLDRPREQLDPIERAIIWIGLIGSSCSLGLSKCLDEILSNLSRFFRISCKRYLKCVWSICENSLVCFNCENNTSKPSPLS